MTNDYAIEVAHLSKRFSDKIAVNDISFTVHAGEVFGLLGPNGAGKTTTLRMMTTLLKPTAGLVKIFGHDVAHESRLARSMFGLTGQYASVDEDISAHENLMIFSRLNGLSREAAKQRSSELLAEFALTDVANKAIKEFSGGMRRRLDLAVSLITRPALIFLDEPTTGLDPRTRTQMWTTIRRLVDAGSTIVLTTQYLDEADELADRVAVIDHGQLIKIGAPAELKKEVGGATLQLTLADTEQISFAKALMAELMQTDIHSKGNLLSAKLANVQLVASVLDQFNAQQIKFSNISVQEPTLDDVFFALTSGKN